MRLDGYTVGQIDIYMKVALMSHKGGVGKTSTAIHVAACLQKSSPALLVDGDSNRSALGWAERANGLPFKVVSEKQSPKYWRDFEHCIIDTGARPDKADLRDLIELTDMIIVVMACDALSLHTLAPTIEALQAVQSNNYRILLSMVPPIGYAGIEARETITAAKLPIFKAEIRKYAAVAKSALFGCLVCDVRDEHAMDAWADYVSISKELMR